MSENFFEQIKLFLPKYLTPSEQRELYESLNRHPEAVDNFYLTPDFSSDFLQGDSWIGFVTINFETLEKKTVSGVIVSNSCDIDPRNNHFKRNILFSPLIKLSNYIRLLETSGRTDTDNIALSIKKQHVTNIFYLPKYGDSIDECIILLDNIYQHPLSDFITREKTKIITLSQYAFYIFLIKLSIHFSRFQENVNRFQLETL